jgi:hypothetical protein
MVRESIKAIESTLRFRFQQRRLIFTVLITEILYVDQIIVVKVSIFGKAVVTVAAKAIQGKYQRHKGKI